MFVIPDVEVGDLDSLCLLAIAARVAAIVSSSATIPARPDCAGRDISCVSWVTQLQIIANLDENELRFAVTAASPALDCGPASRRLREQWDR
jgi:hypothetical protein